MSEPQVLIVGAGPTGLVMALWLAKVNVPFRIIDKNSGPGQTSRAMAVHARTLEFYRQLGIAEEVADHGIKVERLRLHEGGTETGVLNFGDFGKGLSPYPFILTFPQDEHERLLGAKLRTLGMEVEWNTELTGFSVSSDYIEAVLRRNGGEQKCRPNFLCGCDGIHSAVREGLKLKFPGGVYDQMFFVADVAAERSAVSEEINFFLGANELCLTFPIRSTGMVRLIGLLPREDTDRKDLAFEDIRNQFEKLIQFHVHKVNWFSTYHVHHRVAEHFRVGHVFLAGDAGHVHSPAGGQGMNTGIGDAVNLAWKLAAVLGTSISHSILDSYETERVAFAKTLVSTTDKLFQAVVSDNLAGAIVRSALFPRLLPFLMGFSAFRRFQFRLVSQTRISYRESPLSAGSAGGVYGGDRLPWVDSSEGDNFAPLGSLDWQIHVYGKISQLLRQTASETKLPLHEFTWSKQTEQAGLQRDSLYLIRPDGHVALADLKQDVTKLRSFVSKFKITTLRPRAEPTHYREAAGSS
jgi:2-polyprenyl-6-methoxyphenol hydroxylase-like FAD-dependent oxidoreductase